MRRLLTRFGPSLLALVITGCGSISGHGPVSQGTMRKLESRTISHQEFAKRLTGADQAIRLSRPTKKIVVPFELRSGTPVIQAAGPDDKPMDMLLDTGAARLVLGASSAVEARVPTIDARQVRATMHGVIGQESGLVGLLTPLRIGAWTLPTYPCFVRTFENMGEGVSYPANILGFDLPTRYCSYLTLDYPKRQATFAFQEKFRPGSLRHTASAPFRVKDGVAFIDLKSKGVKWSCILDTGSFNGIEIDEALASKLGVQDQGKIVEGLVLLAVGGTMSSDKARLRTVTLPEISLLGGSYQQSEVDISPGIPRVGSFFLKDYRVTFDFRSKRVWLEW